MRRMALVLVAALSLMEPLFVPTPAQAAVPKPTTKAFSIGGSRRVQAFGYDNPHNTIFLTQPTTNGSFKIVEVDNAKPSTRLSSISVTGFGHGNSIGVEPVADTTSPTGARVKQLPYLWLETGPRVKSGDVLYGTRIVRIRYARGHVYKYTGGVVKETASASSTKVLHTYTPFTLPTPKCDSTGLKSAAVTFDPVMLRVVVRFRVGGKSAYRTYNAADLVAKKNAAPAVASIEGKGKCIDSPLDLNKAKKLSFQGFASVNGWIYQVISETENSSKKGNNILDFVRFDANGLNRKRLPDPNGAAAYAKAAGLTGQEVEGMAIRLLTTGGVARPVLRWGITGSSGGTKIAIFQHDFY